jgi:hypothetical protein
MDIQIDSREKARAIKKIVNEFDKQGVNYFTSKLLVGDYMSLDNPRLIIDRKQNLSEVCNNVCQQHERFRKELIKANKAGISLVLLIEHGGQIKSMEDVFFWKNPRQWKFEKDTKEKYGFHWSTPFDEVQQALKEKKIRIFPPTSGEQLYRSLCTIRDRYGVEVEFCDKKDTGKRIIEILGGSDA